MCCRVVVKVNTTAPIKVEDPGLALGCTISLPGLNYAHGQLCAGFRRLVSVEFANVGEGYMRRAVTFMERERPAARFGIVEGPVMAVPIIFVGSFLHYSSSSTAVQIVSYSRRRQWRRFKAS